MEKKLNSGKESIISLTKITLILSLLFITGCFFSGCTDVKEKSDLINSGISYESDEREILYQVSAIDILLAGGYDGFVSVGELKKHGDCGIGTVDMLDGELIATGGEFYSIKISGDVVHLSDSDLIPFAAVTYFDEDYSFYFEKTDNISELEESLSEIIPSKTQFYAIKSKGFFSYVKTRSVPKQEKPYPRLSEVVKNQSIFEFENINGTIIGLWSPSFTSGLNVYKLHIHFISEDKKSGGHVLDLKFENNSLSIDETGEYYIKLPESTLGGELKNPDDEQNLSYELAIVEK